MRTSIHQAAPGGSRRKARGASFAKFAVLAIAAAPLAAMAWTNKPVKVLVPAPAGGTADIVARVVAEALSAEIGQPVIVENKPGAGGAIAVEALKGSPPDGQTLLIAASNILTEVPLVMKTRFDRARDLYRTSFLSLIRRAHETDDPEACQRLREFVRGYAFPARELIEGLPPAFDFAKTARHGLS